jgi:hypothetical protein
VLCPLLPGRRQGVYVCVVLWASLVCVVKERTNSSLLSVKKSPSTSRVRNTKGAGGKALDTLSSPCTPSHTLDNVYRFTTSIEIESTH